MPTIRESEVSRYLHDIRHIPLLSEEEEAALLAECAAGSLEARAEAAERNLRLVVHIAKDYLGKGLPLGDLIQEGSMGLLLALEKFDPAANLRFATYAAYWIRSAIRRAIVGQSVAVRLPAGYLTTRKRVDASIESLRIMGIWHPTFEQIAAQTGMTAELVSYHFEARSAHQSLKAGAGDVVLRDVAGRNDAEQALDSTEDVECLRRFLEQLTPREQFVIQLRHGIGGPWVQPLTIRDIAIRLGVSRDVVRKLEVSAMNKLRSLFDARHAT